MPDRLSLFPSAVDAGALRSTFDEGEVIDGVGGRGRDCCRGLGANGLMGGVIDRSSPSVAGMFRPSAGILGVALFADLDSEGESEDVSVMLYVHLLSWLSVLESRASGECTYELCDSLCRDSVAD